MSTTGEPTTAAPAAPATASAQPSWPGLIRSLLAGHDLDPTQTNWAMGEILAGAATDVAIAGFVVALRAKGETVDEVTGLVEAMLAAAVRIDVPGPTLDVVGTGGDLANTYNISTMAAITAAGAGIRVVKHGNRSASSAVGGADTLEALGVPLNLAPEQVQELATKVGITFCFAQAFHPALRHAGVTRRELGVPTVFNFLGPLTNPAQTDYAAVGVADARIADIVAGVLAKRGTGALVFRGDDGLDELTTTTTSTVRVVADGAVHTETLDPRDLDVPVAEPSALRGGDAAHNAAMVWRYLDGETGPVRDAVLLNAAAAIAAATPSSAPLLDRLRAGWKRAAAAVDSGAAKATLQALVRESAAMAGR
jgi:anthranilate phosphoribosyltransferase